MAVVDRPTTTTDAGGWTESPDQGTPDTPVTSPQKGTNGLDATGQALQPEEATAANEPPRRPDGRFEKNGFRRRAASQQASPDDVPRIQELTRKLREAERERDTLRGGGAPPGAAGPAREGAPSARTPAPAGAPPSPQARRNSPPPPPPPFNLKEPTFEDFKDSADPLRDYTRAQAKHAQLEQQHDLATRYHQQETQKYTEAAQQQFISATEAHWARMAEAGQDPANTALIERFRNDDRPITPAILQAIVRTGQDSAKLTLALLQREGLLEELTLATYDRPATPDLVALVQRRLQSLGPLAAKTGSAAVPVSRPA
ncbi:MAG TPA: hypothetical protein VNN99_14420, partial [Vicinamibacterales bacterium]|nr:hypothetical protein [Vicinamibacterales bacterium]